MPSTLPPVTAIQDTAGRVQHAATMLEAEGSGGIVYRPDLVPASHLPLPLAESVYRLGRAVGLLMRHSSRSGGLLNAAPVRQDEEFDITCV